MPSSPTFSRNLPNEILGKEKNLPRSVQLYNQFDVICGAESYQNAILEGKMRIDPTIFRGFNQ
jgi:hypothetical protein